MIDPEEKHDLFPPELHEQVEKFSLIFERFGFPRMAGRMFAFMLLRDEPLTTQSELTEALNASTGSVSTMIRLLEQLGFVERVSLVGKRRDHFRLTEDPLLEMSMRRIEGSKEMIDIIAAARASKNIGPRADARLARAQSFYEFFAVEMTRALREWKEQQDGAVD